MKPALSAQLARPHGARRIAAGAASRSIRLDRRMDRGTMAPVPSARPRSLRCSRSRSGRVQLRRVSRCLLASLRSYSLQRLARPAIRVSCALRASPLRDCVGRAVRLSLLCPALAPRCCRFPGTAQLIWSLSPATVMPARRHPPSALPTTRSGPPTPPRSLRKSPSTAPRPNLCICSASPRRDSPSRRPATICFSCSTFPGPAPAHLSKSPGNRVSSSPAAHGEEFTALILTSSAGTADIDGQPVLIAAIMPDGDWRFAGHIDALLLEDQHNLAALPAATKGFVIARIRPSAFPPPRGGWRKMVETHNGVTRGFDCISVAHMLGQPFSVFLFALLLATLALPATTALPLGDYPLRHRRPPGTIDARRWIFLAAKFVSRTRYRGSLLHWPGVTASQPATRSGLCTSSWPRPSPPLLFGFRWILQDQRRRCPRVPPPALQPGSRRPGFLQFPLVEWHRALLRPRSRLPPHPRAAHQLVQHAAMALSRPLMAVPVPRDSFRIAGNGLTNTGSFSCSNQSTCQRRLVAVH